MGGGVDLCRGFVLRGVVGVEGAIFLGSRVGEKDGGLWECVLTVWEDLG